MCLNYEFADQKARHSQAHSLFRRLPWPARGPPTVTAKISTSRKKKNTHSKIKNSPQKKKKRQKEKLMAQRKRLAPKRKTHGKRKKPQAKSKYFAGKRIIDTQCVQKAMVFSN